MAEALDNIATCVQGVRLAHVSQRKALLQTLIGHRTDSALILDRRAKLITALREAGLYPGHTGNVAAS